MGMMNIGFGSMINPDRIVAALSPESAPVKRMITKAKSENTLIDATFGRKTKSLLVMENGYIILSALMPETIAARLEDKE